MKYILIAYKPDSASYSRGCLMESFRSDFQYCNYNTLEGLIDGYSKLKAKHREHGEAKYECIVFENGRAILNEMGYDTDWDENYTPPDIQALSEPVIKEIIQKREEVKRLQHEKEIEEQKRAEEEYERRLLEQLQKKYNK